MSVPSFLAPLALVFLAALAAAYALDRLRLPPLIGYLLAGVLLGPHGLAFVSDVNTVEALAQVGVVLLLFTVGLELPLSSLRRLGPAVWIAGPIQFSGVVVLAAALTSARGYPLNQSIFFGFLVVTCSTVIILQILVERRELDSPHGRFLVGINVFGDLMVVPMMLLIGPLAGQSGGGAAGALLALGKAAAAAVLVFFAARFVVPRVLHAVAATRRKELFLLAVLLLVLGTALATSRAGLSLAVGAFLAGLVVSDSDFGHQAMADVAPFRDAFNSLFFVSVGMLFDARILVSHPWAVAAGLALVLFGKAGVASVPPLLLGYGPRVAAVVGISLAQIGEFAFVLLAQGRAANLVSPDVYQVALAATIISMAATPFLFALGHAVGDRVVGLPFWRPRDREVPPEGASRLPEEGHVVIFGFGHMGETLSRVLARAKVPFRVVDLNPERVRKGKAKDIPIEYGDTTSASVLRHAGVQRARAALVLLSDPRATRRTLSLCRSLAPGMFLLARTRYLAEIPELSALGADEVVAEEFETSLEISGRTLRRLGFPLPWVESETDEIRSTREDAFRRFRAPDVAAERLEEALGGTRIEFVSVGPEWSARGRTLRELDLRSAGGAILLAAVRDGKAIVTPDAGFALESNDQLLLLGTDAALEKSLEVLRGS
ncbi:MAG TPA: cation:proton antiporter [Thermoanaerobaculia bacterium]|nr:cation:proton antiporter [Thermoanaerobaculia bacterium]